MYTMILSNFGTMNSLVSYNYTAMFAVNKRRSICDRTDVVTGVPYSRFYSFEQFFPIPACIKRTQVVYNVRICIQGWIG